MVEVVRTETFAKWLAKMRDDRAVAKIANRIKRMADGNFGDCESVCDGVSELRIAYGPGYRVYFVQRGAKLVILLCGGDKSTQAKDIARAKQMAQEVK